jgi:RNA-directed DNA polymerase
LDEGLNVRSGKYVARLKGAKRQNNQLELAFGEGTTSEAQSFSVEGTEAPVAKCSAESRAPDEQWMERVCQRENLWQALKRVRGNGGSPGVDGMTVEGLTDYLKQHWVSIREQLLSGTYKAQPVRRVEIPKPDGGMRKLGIPTVLDRLVQQAVMQVLQRSWDQSFSASSYGFRPGRSAHQAIARAQQHIAAGFRWVVDLDLEKFFDRVNHDKLMGQVARRVNDKRLLHLIRSWLKAGAMENGLVGPTDEGTPQGGPLSPLLSNLVLDQLDRELERRGHRFVRYADDCNIYVRSRRAGQRLMGGLIRLLEGKLKLKVNMEKSAVARPWERKLLGFSFTNGTRPKRRIAPKAVLRFEARIRALTRRTRGVSPETMVFDLGRYLLGWQGYFGFCQTPTVLDRFNKWIRRRLRSAACKQWRTGKTRYARLRELDLSHDLAARTAGHQWGPWRLSRTQALSFAMPATYFDRLGLPRLYCTSVA